MKTITIGKANDGLIKEIPVRGRKLCHHTLATLYNIRLIKEIPVRGRKR